jgi:hypothetical protein
MRAASPEPTARGNGRPAAVHGGDVGRRLGAAGFQRINQDAASGLGKRDFFGR